MDHRQHVNSGELVKSHCSPVDASSAVEFDATKAAEPDTKNAAEPNARNAAELDTKQTANLDETKKAAQEAVVQLGTDSMTFLNVLGEDPSREKLRQMAHVVNVESVREAYLSGDEPFHISTRRPPASVTAPVRPFIA